MSDRSADTTYCSWRIDIDSIIDTFKLSVDDDDKTHKQDKRNNERESRKDLAELLQHSPPEELFTLLAAGNLIDWTVLQHMCIIACSSPMGVSGERLWPMRCACVEQGKRDGDKDILLGTGKRKREKREEKDLKRNEGYALETAIMLDLSLDLVAYDKGHRATIEQISAYQAGFARKEERSEWKLDRKTFWMEHQAYLEDVRKFAISVGLRAFGISDADVHGEQRVEEKIGQGTRAVVVPAERNAKSRKRKRKRSAHMNKSIRTKSSRINSPMLRVQHTDKFNHKERGEIHQPNQLAENSGTTTVTEGFTAGQSSAIPVPSKRSSQKASIIDINLKVRGKVPSADVVPSSLETATNGASARSSTSKLNIRDIKPINKENSQSTGVGQVNKLQSDPTLQLKQVTSATSDIDEISDISDLTSCPSSPVSSLSPPTPDNAALVYSAKKPTHQSRLKHSTPPPSRVSKTIERTSFCLQYMKPDVAKTAYGLIQEALIDDPFALLVAVTLLNRTKGTVAVPIFFTLMSDYPNAEKFAFAPLSTITSIIGRLGLQNNRAKSLVGLARRWHCDGAPPRKGFRYRTLHYPFLGAGSAIRPNEIIADEADDPRDGAFEIGHLPGVGPYALDSWRIFCRDILRGLARGYNGEGADRSCGFEPEWKRVLPKDKELRGFLKWMWAKEGMDWDPETGEKKRI